MFIRANLLLKPKFKDGMFLTAHRQLAPEQSTAALSTHHPDAKYYSVGNLDRASQILS